MERKQFLGATALAAAAIAVTGAATVSDSSSSSNGSAVNCGPAPVRPRPSGSPVAHQPHPRPSDVESAYRRVERVVDVLQKDTNDYGGHKMPAIGFLQQAAAELEQAVAYEQAHPSASSAPI